MSELTKELEQDKAFIERVADRIYKDTDDLEETIPEPEWMDRMTEIAEKYITRFETSYNFANIHLNDNQKIVFEWLKEKTIEENHGFEFALWRALDAIGTDEPVEYELEVFRNMNSIQRKEVLAAFISWIQEQEE